MKEKLVKNPKLKSFMCGGALLVFIAGAATYAMRGGPENHLSEMATNHAPVTRSIVAESPFTQVKDTSEFLGVVIAFLNIIEPNPEGYPPLYLAGFGLNVTGGLSTFLGEAESFPAPRVLRMRLDSKVAYRTYEQAKDYYKAHHRPEDSPITQEEINDFNKFMTEALGRLPSEVGYLALSAVDAYRGLVEGSPKSIGSYAKSPRSLPSHEALDAMPVFKDLREKYAEQSGKSNFVIGESLSSALGALAALVAYDSDRHTDAQYEMANDFVSRLLADHPDTVRSVKLNQGLFTRSYEHAEAYLKDIDEKQGGKLRDGEKAILIYQVMDVLAEQKDPGASVELAERTLEYWSALDPYFKKIDRFAMLMDRDYRLPTMVMFQARSSELAAYAAARTLEIAEANLRVERMLLEREKIKAVIESQVDANRAEQDAVAIRLRKVIKKDENHE